MPDRPVGLPSGPEVAQHQEKEVVERPESGKQTVQPSVINQNAPHGTYYQQWPQESRSHHMSDAQIDNAHQTSVSQDYSYYQTHGSQDNRFPQTPSSQALAEVQAHGRKKANISRTGWIIIAILIALIIGGAVGGGVGGSLAVEFVLRGFYSVWIVTDARYINRKAKDSATAPSASSSSASETSISASTSQPATATNTNTYYAVPSDVTVPSVKVVVDLECPRIDQTSDVVEGVTWDLICGSDFVGPSIDILAATAYSWRDCARACATYNRNSGSNGCVAISYNAGKLGLVEQYRLSITN